MRNIAICPECRAEGCLTLAPQGARIFITCGSCRRWWSIGEIEHTPYFFGGVEETNGPTLVPKCNKEQCSNPSVWLGKCAFHLDHAT